MREVSVLRVLGDTFWPGGPGYAITLFVLIVAIGLLLACTLSSKGEYVQARSMKRLAILIAFVVALIYLTVWIYLALKSAIGLHLGAVWIKTLT